MKVFDAHVHVYPEKIAEKATLSTGDYYGIDMYSIGTEERILEEIKAGKITKCLIHSTATKPEQVEKINDYIAGLKNDHEEFVGFGTMHPDYPDIKGEIQRMIDLGLLGIKIHSDFQGFALDSESAFKIYEAARGKLPILFHVGDAKSDLSHPKKLRAVHNAFPDLQIIAAHLGGYSKWDDAEKYVIGTGMYVDISSCLSFISKERAKRMIINHGTDKVLFGSDFPMHDPLVNLKLFLDLGFSDEDNEKILYKNAEKLLGIKI
ncbi:MAG: TatD family hydrolase [Bacillota bacterium]|nr:TatD family hydrolase [Bacillota bacterium]